MATVPKSPVVPTMPESQACLSEGAAFEGQWKGSDIAVQGRLEGELTLILDEEDVKLHAGDVVIQRGTNHAWSNRSDKACRILYVLIDGRFDPELAAKLKAGH